MLQFSVKIILKAYFNPKVDRQLKGINFLSVNHYKSLKDALP